MPAALGPSPSPAPALPRAPWRLPTPREMAARPRTYRFVPAYARRQWAELCCEAFRRLVTAHERAGPYAVETERAWLHVLYLVRLGLPRTRGGAVRGRRSVKGRLAFAVRSILEGVDLVPPSALGEGVDDEQSESGPAGGDSHPRAAQHQRLPDSAIRRANALSFAGHFQKACRALVPEPLPPLSDQTMDQLRFLHPQLPAAVQPAGSAPLAADPDGVAHIVRTKLANGSAPSLSGWTGELLLPVVESAEACQLLARVITIIMSGAVGDGVARLLLASRLFPLSKPGSLPAQPRIRPIAWGESFYKLAALYALDQCGSLDALFAPLQLAVGVPGGVEVAVHTLRTAAAVPGNLLVQLDITNAFNARDRERIMRAVLAQPQLAPISQLFYWAYCRNSELVVVDGSAVKDVLRSEQGVRQGDPLAPVAFAASMQHILANAASNHPNILVRAILDDITLVGPTADVLAAYADTKAALEREGLVVNAQKCSAVWCHDEQVPAEVAVACANAGLGQVCTWRVILGAWFGPPSQFVGPDGACARWVLEQVRSFDEFFAAVSDTRLHDQAAFNMLRYCAAGKLGFLLRTHHPAACSQAAELFDRNCLLAMSARLGCGALPDQARLILSLPFRKGGCGLRPTTLSAPLAFLSSFALAASFIVAADSPLPARTWHLDSSRQQLGVIIDSIRRSLSAIGLPFDADSFPDLSVRWLDHFAAKPEQAKKLQHTLTTLRENIVYNGLVAALRGSRNGARLSTLISAGGKHGGAWCGAFAGRGWAVSKLSHSHWELAMRLRIGLPLSEPADGDPNDTQLQCACWETFDLSDALAHHVLCCKAFQGVETQRHDDLVTVLRRFCRRAGLPTLLEPGDQGGHKWPDLIVIPPTGAVHIDVSITHPGMPSRNRHGAHMGALVAARAREQAKRTEYKASMAINKGQELVPFVVEAPGAFGESAHRFCQRLARWISEQPDEVPEPVAMNEIVTELSATVQRGNAQLLSLGLIVRRLRRVEAQWAAKGNHRAARRTAHTIERIARDLIADGGFDLDPRAVPLARLRQPAEVDA